VHHAIIYDTAAPTVGRCIDARGRLPARGIRGAEMRMMSFEKARFARTNRGLGEIRMRIRDFRSRHLLQRDLVIAMDLGGTPISAQGIAPGCSNDR